MFLISKAALAGIVFLLLTTKSPGPRPTTLAVAPTSSQEEPAAGRWNDVKRMQEALRSTGHYRGEVDGVFGLRSRASIRGFQKAENLPVTGQLDAQTAGRLGVEPESRDYSGYVTAQDKPSAGIKWSKGSGRTSKKLRKAARAVPPT